MVPIRAKNGVQATHEPLSVADAGDGVPPIVADGRDSVPAVRAPGNELPRHNALARGQWGFTSSTPLGEMPAEAIVEKQKPQANLDFGLLDIRFHA